MRSIVVERGFLAAGEVYQTQFVIAFPWIGPSRNRLLSKGDIVGLEIPLYALNASTIVNVPTYC